MPTFGSLFAGIGGIDLGLERAGWECRFQVEWDPFCQDVLAKHWPDVQRFGDIAAVDWSGVERVDLLAGGFPCQPISGAGKRQAQADERWLWPEFLRSIRALRPRYVLVENVTNLLAINDGSAFGDILGDLAASGYDAAWDCLPAAAVGAPHERDRVWIMAHPHSESVRNGSRDMGSASVSGAPAEPEWQWVWTDALDGSPAMADSERVDGQRIEPRSNGPDQRKESPQRSAGLCGGAGRDGIGTAQSRVDRTLDGPSSWVDGHRWPAPPGPQYDWEPPRTVVGRLPNRSRRIKALGNAVVPQVVEFIGRRILEAEAS